MNCGSRTKRGKKLIWGTIISRDDTVAAILHKVLSHHEGQPCAITPGRKEEEEGQGGGGKKNMRILRRDI